mmetsp:Transcript_1219/g.1860  ORF Transcript_1219/g.1860 Transcript_1219/m.1860 type:complete len:212 (-) Transcript_1219:246-881(-)
MKMIVIGVMVTVIVMIQTPTEIRSKKEMTVITMMIIITISHKPNKSAENSIRKMKRMIRNIHGEMQMQMQISVPPVLTIPALLKKKEVKKQSKNRTNQILDSPVPSPMMIRLVTYTMVYSSNFRNRQKPGLQILGGDSMSSKRLLPQPLLLLLLLLMLQVNMVKEGKETCWKSCTLANNQPTSLDEKQRWQIYQFITLHSQNNIVFYNIGL